MVFLDYASRDVGLADIRVCIGPQKDLLHFNRSI